MSPSEVRSTPHLQQRTKQRCSQVSAPSQRKQLNQLGWTETSFTRLDISVVWSSWDYFIYVHLLYSSFSTLPYTRIQSGLVVQKLRSEIPTEWKPGFLRIPTGRRVTSIASPKTPTAGQPWFTYDSTDHLSIARVFQKPWRSDSQPFSGILTYW